MFYRCAVVTITRSIFHLLRRRLGEVRYIRGWVPIGWTWLIHSEISPISPLNLKGLKVRNLASIFDRSRVWWTLASKRCNIPKIWNRSADCSKNWSDLRENVNRGVSSDTDSPLKSSESGFFSRNRLGGGLCSPSALCYY